jgi:hypothetical protein
MSGGRDSGLVHAPDRMDAFEWLDGIQEWNDATCDA